MKVLEIERIKKFPRVLESNLACNGSSTYQIIIYGYQDVCGTKMIFYRKKSVWISELISDIIILPYNDFVNKINWDLFDMLKPDESEE